MNAPINDLERAYAASVRGPEGNPELFRLLRESKLIFLLPYHPEMEGTFSLGNGDAVPKFSLWKSSDGIHIPIFTSKERANEAFKRMRSRDKEYAIAEMKGQELFHLISCQPYAIVINPACKIAATYMDMNAVKKLADGSILKPVEDGATHEGTVNIVEPADYPTDFLQPLFRFLRERPQVKAAWLFRHFTPADPTRTYYVFALRVIGDAEKVKQDFAVVAHAACPEKTDYGVMIIDPKDQALARVTSTHPAFYAAPDYKSPSPLGGGIS